ncbi:uncharacterized protein HaLaN_06210 [Haematococcus lacustris]|uniref:Amidase domain-containing protein n=1 Tax=Haematococcus lacustris TaxID=44745 RepID=A0A699YVH9_HAELA|nr:uncharacterized protein HaLaN_06210 [Haematococcus lacustris]
MDAQLHVPGADSGPLAGCTVAVKDMYDIEGQRTGFGNPAWRSSHPPASVTAAAVQLLLSAGASVVGRTHMDELAYSLNGENAHYGTPRNPAAPGRIPGGSSSGSAVAVAAGHTDIGLGSDTGGSVRVPASYCGVLGFRPSWGRLVDILGSQPQEVELGGSCPELRAAGLAKLTSWLDVFRVCQAWEVWQAHGDWVSGHDPQFGPGIRDRFLMASKITRQEWEAACQQRQLITKAVLQVLGNDGVLMLPTAPGPAPMCNTPPHELDAWRQRMISLTCIAGLTGAPQVNLPVATVGGLPVGLSLLGPPGSDERLLELAERVFALCGAEEASGAQGCA